MVRNLNHLDSCLYCPGSRPRNRAQAKRLRDTRANQARELSLFLAIGRAMGVEIIHMRRRRRRRA